MGPKTTPKMWQRQESSRITPTGTPSEEPISARTGRRTRTLLDTEWPRPSTIGPELLDNLSSKAEPARLTRTRVRRRRESSPSESFKQIEQRLSISVVLPTLL